MKMFDNNMYSPYGQPATWRQPAPMQMQAAPPMQRTAYGYNQLQTMTGNIQWIRVNGPQGARDVSVPPNGEAWIMDESRPVFYLKQANAIGQAVTKAFRFEEIGMDDTGSGPDLSLFATKEDIAAINRRLEKLDKFANDLGGVTE